MSLDYVFGPFFIFLSKLCSIPFLFLFENVQYVYCLMNDFLCFLCACTFDSYCCKMGMEKTWFVKCYFYFKDFDKHKVEFELFFSFSLFSTYIFDLNHLYFHFQS